MSGVCGGAVEMCVSSMFIFICYFSKLLFFCFLKIAQQSFSWNIWDYLNVHYKINELKQIDITFLNKSTKLKAKEYEQFVFEKAFYCNRVDDEHNASIFFLFFLFLMASACSTHNDFNGNLWSNGIFHFYCTQRVRT